MSKKKVFKRVGLTFAILILLLVIAISIAIWFVFTPEKLTPIVRKQAANYITCKSEIGEVELTFFSTFPRFGLKVSRFTLINPFPGAQSDTLVNLDQLIGVVDVGAWWKRNELVLTDLQLINGAINAFVDSLGKANFDITPPDTIPVPVDTTESAMPFSFIDIRNVEFNNIALSYIDNDQKMQAGIQDLVVKFDGKLISDTLNMHLKVSDCIMSFNYEGEDYLKNASITLYTPAKVILSKQLVQFGDSELSINEISLAFDGTVENDAVRDRINTNINYKSKKFPVSSALALIPPSYQSYTEGMTIDGIASSDGKITGFYSDSVMPLMDLHIIMYEGTFKYEGLPLPLSNMKGDCVFYSDLTSDVLTYFRINQFSATTPKSSFSTKGIITRLFSDIHMDLTTSTSYLNLSEFAPMMPADMNMTIKGSAAGTIRTVFTMEQLDKMLLDKMKFSGSVALSNFDVLYDSIYMKSDYSKVDFSLPNQNTSSKNTKYLYAKINSKSIDAGIIDSYRAFMTNSLITLETSDVMDTTRLPDVKCSFAIDSLTASMDTIKFSAWKPNGNITLFSKKDKNTQDRILLEYNNESMKTNMGSNMSMRMNKGKLNADVVDFLGSPLIKLAFSGNNLAMQMDTNIIKMDKAQMNLDLADFNQPKVKFGYSGENLDIQMGKSNSVRIGKIQLNSDVANDTTQKDIFLQWPVKGFLTMEKGFIAMSMLNQPLEIPAIKMDFDPEVFNIKESRLKIDRSDFSLSGTLSNIKSYFKKDSLLRGNFNFESAQTDVLQLMSLTSGLGNDSIPADTTVTGPYMVPKGVDFTLRTKIGKAFFGTEIAKDITGDVRVKDGILVLDELVFTTPASKMQLTAMYKTPRKNHIYAGFDYHMLDIEIESLMKMIPDLDSIMPMLRSFRGRGEFHMAAETYLDSMYNPKKSTIRGAASIKGHDLVLMDGETFTEIAKTLRFNKKAENKVDSLSAEFTVFKQEIDIYPFMIVMDRYKAVVAGRHNMDMSFNYNISLLESPLPIKICVNVSGTMDNIKPRPTKCKYSDLNRPSSRMLVQNKQLELRRLIRESLIKNVKK
ncbi:MAG: hypothetical protein AB9846_05365 [Tenuifilaceae bacterium]